MTQIMLPAVFSRKDFDNILRSMSDEDAASFAATNRTTFASCFSLSAPGSGTADVRPASPGPAKAREPKASPTVDKASLDAAVLARVADLPDQRSATIASVLYDPARHGDDDKRFGDIVRASLTRLVTAGKVYQDGTRKNARYKAKAAPPHQEDGGNEAT